MVSEPVLPNTQEDSMAVLTKERERLSNLLALLQEEITQIKSKYPYTMKALLQDKEKIAEKKRELQEIISQLTDIFEQYKVKIDEMGR